MSKHTPTPWNTSASDTRIIGADKIIVADLYFGEARELESIKANAAHIVKCVNLHDELVHELSTIERYYSDSGLDNKAKYEGEPEYQILMSVRKLLRRARGEK